MPIFFKLKKRKDFVRASKSGISIATRNMVIQAVFQKENMAESARIGDTTTKKIGKANVRNRCRRRLRAAAALFFANLALPNVDYVFIARYNTANSNWQDLCKDMQYGLKKINKLLNGETDCAEQNDKTSVSAIN